ncbi:MAG TPA: zinc-binding dehydrogenase [Microlunatus sp.]
MGGSDDWAQDRGDGMTDSMRAVFVERVGPLEMLRIHQPPIPRPAAGQLPNRVNAFGQNRSELRVRQGLTTSASVPRIEATANAAQAPGRELARSAPVVTEGSATIRLGRVYQLHQVVQAHRDMEAGAVAGKGVVLT